MSLQIKCSICACACILIAYILYRSYHLPMSSQGESQFTILIVGRMRHKYATSNFKHVSIDFHSDFGDSSVISATAVAPSIVYNQRC